MNNNALVYIHIFADGSKYFGNGVNDQRPFTQGSRGKKYQEALEKYEEPVVQVRRNLTIVESDTLERDLFDRYIATGGVALQKRPSGKDLQMAVMRNSRADPLNMCKPKSDEAKRKMSIAQRGKPKSDETKRNMSIAQRGKPNRGRRKVISMLDGRVTNASASGHWNKKNPDYIGTWVDL